MVPPANDQGNQGASKEFTGLLEVIKSDFEHTVETVSSAEKKAETDFIEFDSKK